MRRLLTASTKIGGGVEEERLDSGRGRTTVWSQAAERVCGEKSRQADRAAAVALVNADNGGKPQDVFERRSRIRDV